MKKNIMLPAIVSVLLLIACSKSESESPPLPQPGDKNIFRANVLFSDGRIKNINNQGQAVTFIQYIDSQNQDTGFLIGSGGELSIDLYGVNKAGQYAFWKFGQPDSLFQASCSYIIGFFDTAYNSSRARNPGSVTLQVASDGNIEGYFTAELGKLDPVDIMDSTFIKVSNGYFKGKYTTQKN